MRLLPVFSCFVLLVMACGVEEPAQTTIATEDSESGTVVSTVSAIDISSEIARSRDAIQAFAGELNRELASVMQLGDPVAGIRICNTEANLITAKASGEYGLNLGRVSIKNRNPANYPNDWQARVLLEFELRKDAGEAIETLEWSDVVEAGDRQEFRYMKAIPAHDSCDMCHGLDLAPEVKEVLAELYPDDLGRGFREGDIRGAFVVRGVLAEENGG